MFGHIALVLCNILCIIELCYGSAVIEVRLVSFNSTGLLTSKVCCDTQTPGPCPKNQCDPIFFICLQDFSGSGCSLGNVTTGYIPNTDAIVFSDVIGSTRTPNPCVFNVDNYPGVVIAKVTVFDEDMVDGGKTNDKIDYLQYVYSFAPDKNGTSHKASTIPLTGAVSTLDIEISVNCDQNYYGNKCDILCVPDTLFYCDENGQRVCRKGKTCTATSTNPSEVRTTTPFSTSSFQTNPTTSAIAIKSSSRKFSTGSSKTTSTGISTGTVSSVELTKASSFTDSSPAFETPMPSRPTSTGSPFVPSTTVNQPNNETTVPSSTATSLSTPNETHQMGCSYNASTIENGEFMLHMVGYNKDIKPLIESQIITKLDKENLNTKATVHEQQDDDRTTYTIILDNIDGGSMFNSSIIDEVLEDFCTKVTARSDYQITKGDKSDNIKIIVPVVIIGLLALLSIPMGYFIYRRKCKNRKIGIDDKQDIPKNQGKWTLS